MKRLLILILLASVPVFGIETLGELGPATSTSNVTIAAPGAGKQNCISTLHIGISSYGGAASATIRIVDGLAAGTTIYSLVVSTNTGLQTPNPIVINADPDDPICSSSNNALQIKNTATTFDINYQGYVRGTR